jgi:riboflavin biosynthesis pyrimidine reductase
VIAAGLHAIGRMVTIEDRSKDFPLTSFGNEWSRKYYDGPFHVFSAPPGMPAISLVFVQSRDGNTSAHDPAALGGGPTDKYLLYEGLTRVAADAVLAGAASVGHHVFFTVTHPELAALRRDLGLPQHPFQMVISSHGNVDLSARALSSPDTRAFLLAGPECVRKLSSEIRARPWITMIPIENDLAGAFRRLKTEHGIGRISAVGGRTTATSLVDAGLVQDLYLTTSTTYGGEADTPWYAGTHPPRLETIVRKSEVAVESPILFEHLAINRT